MTCTHMHHFVSLNLRRSLVVLQVRLITQKQLKLNNLLEPSTLYVYVTGPTNLETQTSKFSTVATQPCSSIQFVTRVARFF
jgi:hypothetical protein